MATESSFSEIRLTEFSVKLDANVLPVCITLLVIAIALGGDSLSEVLRYQYTPELGIEGWRYLSGHFVHLNWMHTGLNLVGLWLIWLLVGSVLSQPQWIVLIAFLALAIAAGLHYGSPEVTWYVGLSGMLYGMLVAVLVFSIGKGFSSRQFLLLAVAAKMILEQYGIELSIIQGDTSKVIVDAHLYGACAGVVAGCFLRCFKKQAKGAEGG